jgi:hypothetical protein
MIIIELIHQVHLVIHPIVKTIVKYVNELVVIMIGEEEEVDQDLDQNQEIVLVQNIININEGKIF